MPFSSTFLSQEPSREQIDQLESATVLEFGTDWCGYCRAAQPFIEETLSRHAGIQHLKIEDGKGRPLGRSFRVKLWPTLVFVKNGEEVGRVVRPQDSKAISYEIEKMLATQR